MACRPFKIGAVSGIVCGPRPKVAPCDTCGRPHVALCDYQLNTTPPRTCDKKICAGCRKPMPGDRDYCPAHRRLVDASSK